MGKQPSILIVACDPYLAGIYGRKFELDGWEVDIAETLTDGERKATRMRPSVIILDADCAADISAEVTRLKALPTLLRSHVVILAGKGDRIEIQNALEAGAATYLLLGHFVPQEAVAKMRALLKK